MATKSQLKTYFEKGDIPTSAQFGELIDSMFITPSDNNASRQNQTLKFGTGDSNGVPFVNGLRIIHKYINDDVINNYWLFTTQIDDNLQVSISVPIFIIRALSDIQPSVSENNPNVGYYIPVAYDLDTWIRKNLDCNNSSDDDIYNQLITYDFNPIFQHGIDLNTITIIYNDSNNYGTYVFEVSYIGVGGSLIKAKLPLKCTYFSKTLNSNNLECTVYKLKPNVVLQNLINDWNTVRSSIMDKPVTTTSNSVINRNIGKIINDYMVTNN